MAPDKKPRVLVVDDEGSIQQGLRMLLRKEYDVTTASSGPEGLKAMTEQPEWDIVMSDMRMPGMDGAEFLSKARTLAPNTVRILLTGQADTESAISAVNEGQVFRFMCKPCTPSTLRSVLAEAAAHRNLLTAEKQILESTLRESLLVLSDVLGTVHPHASLRCERMRDIVLHVSTCLGFEDVWQLELAAALSHLGCIPLPATLVNSALGSDSLSEKDLRAWNEHPAWGAELIAAIPRLEAVADIIRNQRTTAPKEWTKRPLSEWPMDVLGAELLRTALDYLGGLARQKSAEDVLAALGRDRSYQPLIVEALAGVPAMDFSGKQRSIGATELRAGMTLLEDLNAKAGLTLACAGSKVSQTMVRLARNFSARGELQEPFRVGPPAEDQESTETD